jgi:hypothetical protein
MDLIGKSETNQSVQGIKNMTLCEFQDIDINWFSTGRCKSLPPHLLYSISRILPLKPLQISSTLSIACQKNYVQILSFRQSLCKLFSIELLFGCISLLDVDLMRYSDTGIHRLSSVSLSFLSIRANLESEQMPEAES